MTRSACRLASINEEMEGERQREGWEDGAGEGEGKMQEGEGWWGEGGWLLEK